MHIEVKKEELLLDVLINAFPGMSKSSAKKIIVHGGLTVNGRKETNPAAMVSKGSKVEYTRHRGTAVKTEPPLPILFEDDYYLACLKPAGLLSVPTEQEKDSNCHALLQEFVRKRSKGHEQVFVVHRLDREVAGILLFARTQLAQMKIKEAWKQVDKTYCALVEGKVPKKAGTIKTWLKEDANQKVYVTKEEEGAQLAITHFKVIQEWDEFSQVEVKLETGKKNQIRVHLVSLGCPIVGDRRYGANASVVRQIRLFAIRLSFVHPFTSKKIMIEATLPKNFLKPGKKDEQY
ncbi:MAG: RluA family pseudouridine synthase [Bacteroidetes bacterium]|nr:RluA family pseudouridine synthase [Bacteroidota bacterium]